MSVVRKSILTVFGTGVLGAANLGIGVLLARWLSPDGLGQYALLASTATLVGILGSMGMGGASIYFVNRRGMDRGVATTVVARTSMGVGLVLGALAIPAVGLEAYFGSLPPFAAVAVGALLFGKVVIPSTMYVLMAAMRVFRYVVVQVFPSVALLAGAGLLALVGALTLGPALWAAAAGQLVGVAVLLWFVRDDTSWRRPFRWEELRPLLGYGVLINLGHFAYMAGTDGGLFVVRSLTPAFDEVGFYQAALRLSSVVLMGVMAVGPLLFSKYAASDDATRRRQVARTSRVAWPAVIVAVAALEWLAGPIVLLLFGPEFEPAIGVVQIMLFGMAARALAAPVLEMFYSVGAPVWVVAVLGLDVVAMVGFMLLWVPTHGAAGGAAAFVAANWMGLALGYAVAGARFGIRLRDCLVITRADVRFVVDSLR